MTNVYGVTFIGARLQIFARLKDRGDIPENKIYLASNYLSQKVFFFLSPFKITCFDQINNK